MQQIYVYNKSVGLYTRVCI